MLTLAAHTSDATTFAAGDAKLPLEWARQLRKKKKNALAVVARPLADAVI